MIATEKAKRWLGRLLIAGTSVVLLGVCFVWWMRPGRYVLDKDWELPTKYVADRYFAVPTASNGIQLSFLADTGGGLFVTTHALRQAGVGITGLPLLHVARMPAFRADAAIPEPTGGERWMPIADRDDSDGMLGQRWFAGGVWTFDYPAHKLILRAEHFSPTDKLMRHAVDLGFARSLGLRRCNHPRFTVTIDGQQVSSLFDTGATVFLTPEAIAFMNDNQPVERATSFATAAVFERWHHQHPEWRYIEKGCKMSQQPMIEVPLVRISGLDAGPVWFTRRPDSAMQWMSQFLDAPIEASIGGDCLRHFTITLDYPGAKAYFVDD